MNETDYSPRVLVIDDEEVICQGCRRILTPDGYHVETRQSPVEGLNEALNGRYDIVLLDMKMPELDGLDVLKQIRAAGVESEVIVITGYSSVQSAVDVMKLGAVDYVCKPFTPEELRVVVEKAAEGSPVIRRARQLNQAMGARRGFQGIIGESPAMQTVFSLIQKVAPTTSGVLITGESGVGKELAARAIHRLSTRSEQPFLACDCSSLAPTLLESELFGHVKGSFSGAVSSKKGLFEVAHNGTLFLDELSNISLEIQGKLLRVLETRRVKKVGDVEEREIDIRLVTASNRDLVKMVKNREFREDLYYRINVVPIHIPPLRDRTGDIPLLAASFLERISRDSPSAPHSFMPQTMSMLQQYDWPGNVRELRNLIERVAVLCDADRIEPHHLPEELRGSLRTNPGEPPIPQDWDTFKDFKKSVRDAAVHDVERRFLVDALKRAKGNVSKAAESVGMQRTNFHALMTKHGVNAETYQ